LALLVLQLGGLMGCSQDVADDVLLTHDGSNS
jgi:hypothetical protein